MITLFQPRQTNIGTDSSAPEEQREDDRLACVISRRASDHQSSSFSSVPQYNNSYKNQNQVRRRNMTRENQTFNNIDDNYCSNSTINPRSQTTTKRELILINMSAGSKKKRLNADRRSRRIVCKQIVKHFASSASPHPLLASLATIVLLSLVFTTCLHMSLIKPASGFLLFSESETSSSNQQQASSAQQQPSASSSSASSSSSSGIIAKMIIDTAAKAAISSLSSGSSSSADSAAASSPAASGSGTSSNSGASSESHAPAAKSLSSSATDHKPSGASSIVASLSSAVASAAVASAVAAARNSINPSPSSSSKLHSSSALSSQSRSNHHSSSHKSHHQSILNAKANNSPLNHIAIRLADAIPEVPYSILHNMKKLDHAAPFYNVDSTPVSKASGSQASLAAAATGGIRKESSPLSSVVTNLLSSAISAASGAASNGGTSLEQLGAIFRTPLWRRLADGYGDFAAEFRSFFKPGSSATGALATVGSVNSPSKASAASTSSMSQLMRELTYSIPVIMVLASKAMKSDWRPTRTNRKSFMQNILGTTSSSISPEQASLDPIASASSLSPLISSAVSASPFLSSIAADPMQMSGSNGIDSITGQSSGEPSFGSQILNAMQQQAQQQQQQQQQANFFPSFMQSNPMAAAQDAMSQRATMALRRMGDSQQPQHHRNEHHNQPPLSGDANLNSNGLNYNLNHETNDLNALNNKPGDQAKPVMNSLLNQDLQSLSSNVGPLTLLNGNTNNQLHMGQQGHLIGHGTTEIDDHNQFQARSMNEQQVSMINGQANNWISSQQQQQPQPAVINNHDMQVDSHREAKTVQSRTGKFWQNLIHAIRENQHHLTGLSALSISDGNKQQEATGIASKRRQDDTKLIALNDKHRYSLVIDNENDNNNSQPGANSEQAHKQSILSSAVSHIMQGLNPSKSTSQPASASNSDIVAANPASESGLSGAQATGNQQQMHLAPSLPQALAQTSSNQNQQQHQAAASNPEQRDLSQLVPQSWKDAVKRTYSNVQQSASTQWRSIEGQISSWLKPGAAGAASATSANNINHFHTPAQSPPGLVSGFFSNVGSAAVNMLGFGSSNNANKHQPGAHSSGSSQASGAAAATQTSSANSAPASTTTGQDSSSNKQPQKTGLVGMASMIFNSITGSRTGTSNNSGQDGKTVTTFTKPTSTPAASVSPKI